jgi:hypothetical protein
MNPETIKQVLDSLEKNGSAALDGIAANAVMQAWGHFFILALLLIIAGGIAGLTLWLWRKAKDADFCDDYLWGAGALVSGIVSAIFIIGFIVGLFDVPSDIATIKNPRAAAVRLLIQR